MRKTLHIASLLALMAVASVSCIDVPAPTETEELGSFVCDGDTYIIRSVVLYETEGNQTQIWMSETAGYTTLEEIEASAGELVITVPISKIGVGKQTFQQKGDFILYDEKENSGWCVINCSIDKEKQMLSVEFSAESLKAGLTNQISGKYEGPYNPYVEKTISNQWAYNRNIKALTSAELFEMEDGANNRITLYDAKGAAVEIDIKPELIGYTAYLNAQSADITSVRFSDGEVFNISGAYGQAKTSLEGDMLTASIRLTDRNGKVLRAEYQGPFRKKLGNKTDRLILTDEKGSQYNGKTSINGFEISGFYNGLTFRFTGSGLESFLVPSVSLPFFMMNTGRVYLKNYSEATWSVSYAGTAFPPISSTVLLLDENSYVDAVWDETTQKLDIDMEIGYTYTQKEQVKVLDDEGNEIMVDSSVQATDALGNLLYDDDDNPIYVKIPLTEEQDVPYSTWFDLHYSDEAND